MKTLAILPVKSFGAAKQRLAESLGAGSRQALAQAMFADVLGALRRTDELDEVVVVTSDPAAESAARGHGVLVLADTVQAGQSQATQIGIQHALEHGFDRVALVPGDTPLVQPADLAGLLARSGHGVSVVPDRHGTGTNALVLTPPDAIEPSFGPDSRARHVARRRRRGRAAPGRRGGRARARRGHAGRPRGAGGRAGAWTRSGRIHPRGPASARPRRRGPRASLRLSSFSVTPLAPLPAIRPGDDLAGLIAAAAPGDLSAGRRRGGGPQGRLEGGGTDPPTR